MFMNQVGRSQAQDGRVNIDILGISEIKWTGMDEFNSDDHYIYYCGQEPLKKKWGNPYSEQMNPRCSIWV